MEETWNKVLTQVKPISASIAGLLQSAHLIDFKDKTLKLSVYYKFHKDKLEEAKTKKMLEEVTASIFGESIRIECLLAEAPLTQNRANLQDINEKSVIKAAEELFL